MQRRHETLNEATPLCDPTAAGEMKALAFLLSIVPYCAPIQEVTA
jgi:hypothetical protein